MSAVDSDSSTIGTTNPVPGETQPGPAAQNSDEASRGLDLTPRLRELLLPQIQAAQGMVEAEDALALVRESFQRTEDPEIQSELAADALEHVNRQLQLIRQRRQQLDGVEGKLWARRNRLERLLIQRRGSDWWHARNNREAPAQQSSS